MFQIKLHNDQRQEVIARPVTLVGRVTDIGRMGKATNTLYLENCIYDNFKIPGRVQVVLFDGSSFQTGDILTLNGTLRSIYIFANDFNTTCLRNNCHYQLTDFTVVSTQGGKLTLAENIREYIYYRCKDTMLQFDGLMYALITGDANALETDVKSFYQQSGMIHLIAVSGMHLVYIITIIGFFIKKLKLNPIVEFAVVIGPLVFFCYICNWAPSILRALLMTVCTYLVRWLSGRYDMLIALSWSVVVLLLFNAYYLFDVGWQLSVMSVLGMATVHLRIDRFLRSKRLNKLVYGLLSSLSISISCTLATFATIAYYFGEVPILGVFANIIGVPLMSWAFTAGLVGLLPWVFRYALLLADGILWAVTQVARFVSSLDIAVVALSAVALAIAVTIAWLLVAGQYVNLNKTPKLVVNCTLCVLLVVCFVLSGVKLPCAEQVYVDISFEGANVVVTNQQGEALVLSDCQSSYSLQKIRSHLAKYKYKSLTWVFYDISNFDCDKVDTKDFVALGVEQVYNLSHTGNDVLVQSLQHSGIAVTQVANNQAVGNGITVQSVYDGSLVGVVVNTQSLTFAVVDGGVQQTNHFVNIIPSADFYILETLTPTYLQQNLTTFSLYQDYCGTNYGANKYGNFTITQKDDTIIVNF